MRITIRLIKGEEGSFILVFFPVEELNEA